MTRDFARGRCKARAWGRNSYGHPETSRENTRTGERTPTGLWNSQSRPTVHTAWLSRTGQVNANVTLEAHASQLISLGSFLYRLRWSDSITISDVLGLDPWENVLMLSETRIFPEEEGHTTMDGEGEGELCGGGLGLKTRVNSWFQNMLHVRAWYISTRMCGLYVCVYMHTHMHRCPSCVAWKDLEAQTPQGTEAHLKPHSGSLTPFPGQGIQGSSEKGLVPGPGQNTSLCQKVENSSKECWRVSQGHTSQLERASTGQIWCHLSTKR